MDHPIHTSSHVIRRRSFLHLARACALLMSGLFLLIAPRAVGQCSQWVGGPFDLYNPGADVEDLLMFDLDGGGPQPASLVAATNSGVWVWDNSNWTELGTELTSATALATFNGSLVAAATAGASGRRVARWNGNGWVLMGGPFEFSGELPEIRNLAVFSNSLFVGGSFTGVGGVPISRVARWDGSAWVAAGSGVTFTPKAMAVFDLDGSGPNPERLIVAGYSHLVLSNGIEIVSGVSAQWTGTQWDPPEILSFGVRDFQVVGNQLYACGLDDVSNGTATRAVLARWSGSTFLQHEVLPLQEGSQMNRMAEWSGNVVAVGSFDFPGSDNVLLFNTSSLQSLPLAGGRPNGAQTAACAFGNSIVVAESLADIVQTSGSTWSRVASSGAGEAFATLGSRLVVGGNFSKLTGQEWANNLAAWNGSQTTDLAGGTNGPVRALEGYAAGANNNLVVGGSFTRVGEGIAAINVNNIAERIEPLLIAATWSSMGNGFNGSVRAVERVLSNQIFDEAIFAGGEFTAAGTGSPAFSRIAQWYGSPPVWSAMGTGFNNTVRAIKAYNSGATGRFVIAGGDFTAAGGVAANRIASWAIPVLPPGPAWAAMGSGFNGSVLAIERYNGATYAAGAFTASGVVAVNRIARWTGTTWAPVGNGTGFNDTVRALLVIGAFLYAAGDFTSVDGTPANHIARWNGAGWTDAGSNINVPMLALGAFHGEIHAGLASEDTSARYLADTPWIAQQPQSQTVACGQSVTFQLSAAQSYSGLTYTWRKDGVPLTEGPTGHGSLIDLGFNSVTILNVRGLDAGGYDCVLSSAQCGSVTSGAPTLTVNGTCPPCPADTNADGAINVTDLLAVIGAWGRCSTPPPPCAADVNQSGMVDVTDLLAVIGAWGACP